MLDRVAMGAARALHQLLKVERASLLTLCLSI
jgi:hypothetical protein